VLEGGEERNEVRGEAGENGRKAKRER